MKKSRAKAIVKRTIGLWLSKNVAAKNGFRLLYQTGVSTEFPAEFEENIDDLDDALWEVVDDLEETRG